MHSTPFDIVFCDTCVCGSTVASHLAKARTGLRALFLADYAVNPLGIKSHGEVSEALNRWVDAAVGRAPILIVACNTASVRLQDAPEVVERAEHLGVRLYSMVDLLDALIRAESHRLKNERVCLMGTEYTVSSSFYRDRMKKAGVSVVVPLAATATERLVARLGHTSSEGRAVIRDEIEDVLRDCDSVLLACTCFPLVGNLIQELMPGIRLLDPGQGIEDLPGLTGAEGPNRLTIGFSGDVKTAEELSAQAASLFPGWELTEVLRLQ